MKPPAIVRIAAVLTCSCIAAPLPALCQPYNMDGGTSRIIFQDETGLNNPSSTYIGPGTLSRSAQGKGVGIGDSLPAVNMGSHVRTPGDNLYNNDGTDRQANGALIYQDQERAMTVKQRRQFEQAMRRRRSTQAKQQALQQQGNLYIPGSNGASVGYDLLGNPGLHFNGNGTATYSQTKNSSLSF